MKTAHASRYCLRVEDERADSSKFLRLMTNSPAEGSRAQKEVEDLLADTVPGTCRAENRKGDRQEYYELP